MSTIDSNEKQLICQDEKTLEFIRKARLKQGDTYDYSKVVYTKSSEKVIIICKIHGEFLQTPNNHLNGQKCLKCKYEKLSKNLLYSKETFIEKSNLIHNNFYDYSLVEYVNSQTKVKIICPIHGIFEQKANDHLNGRGCKKCSDIVVGNKKRYSLKNFIDKARIIHGNKYSYIKSLYKGSKEKLEIICNKHEKSFWQSPSDHLNGSGCPLCKSENTSKSLMSNISDFIIKANLKHGDLYDYSLSIYRGNKYKIEIICPIHGSFWQKPNNHLGGKGCPKCNSSKGEIKIRNYLNSKNIEFVEQKTFPDCRDKKLLRFDFYIPSLNLCIEYDGRQHFEPTRFSYSITEEKATKNLKSMQNHDNIKNKYCKDNNINLLRIKYDKNIEEEINHFLK